MGKRKNRAFKSRDRIVVGAPNWLRDRARVPSERFASETARTNGGMGEVLHDAARADRRRQGGGDRRSAMIGAAVTDYVGNNGQWRYSIISRFLKSTPTVVSSWEPKRRPPMTRHSSSPRASGEHCRTNSGNLSQ